MKIKLTLAATLFCLINLLQAQSPISLTNADMPARGFTETYAVDTPLTSVNYGNAGANQVYNFSAFTNTHSTTLNYLAPTNQQHTNFPTCTHALTTDNSTFIFLDSTASKLQAVGVQGYAFGLLVNSHFSPIEDLYHFPTQYGSTYHSNWGFTQTFTGAQVGQSVDSVREVYTDHFSVLADGWGKVITPTGSYRALRIKRIDTTVTEIDAYYFFAWHSNVTANSPVTNITTEYSYVAKETKGAVVSFTYDSAGNMKNAQYSLIPPAPPVAGFSSVNGNAGLVTFTDTSAGYPNRYYWNFGDGDTSNVANPTHTYTANGTYYVCETVYNPSGSNTVCDSVHVTSVVVHLPPVANNDSATVHQPNSTTINVTANDNSPSSDAFCVTAVYGGLYFSVSNCTTVAFNPNPGYTGYDTAHYIICNTGQPTLCDTALVIVHVISSATHYPPVANGDVDTLLQPGSSTFNVTANDNSPSSDTFCITAVYGSADFGIASCSSLSFHPDSTFFGNDTVYYVVCNTGQPTLCDTGSVIVTVNANPALLPVNNFTLTQVHCGGLIASSLATNADSLMWNFTSLAGGFHFPDSTFYNAPSVQYGVNSDGVKFQVCLTAENKFGSSIKCDTLVTGCEGIQSIQLSGINIYPNPATSHVTIDMRDNTSGIINDYKTIEIYNGVGQLVKSLNHNGNSGVLSIAVGNFAPGIYLATIVTGTGQRNVLGKFNVTQ